MKQLVRNVKIIGTGSYTPETIYTNKYLETIIDTSDAWIQECTAPAEDIFNLGICKIKPKCLHLFNRC